MSGHVVTVGETMALLHAHRVGPLAHQDALGLGIGGSESNVAIGLRRLGVDVVWCGRVGDDSLGELVHREIRAEGVRTHVTVDPSAPTGLMLKERPTASAQRVAYYRSGSAGSRLSAGDVPDALLEGAALVHLSGITAALSGSARETVRSLARRARAAGARVSYDVNHRSALWSRAEAGDFHRSLLAEVDVVFAGQDEALLVLGDPGGDPGPAELARQLAGLGPTEVVVKLGADGALAHRDGSVAHVPAVRVDVVDTVGAGDAFVAGYLAETVAGADVPTALRTGAAAGAFVCTVPGDWEGLPRRRDLDLLGAAEPVLR